jgi:hypothetical protein
MADTRMDDPGLDKSSRECMRPETRDPRPETRDPRPETRDPRPETRDPSPEFSEGVLGGWDPRRDKSIFPKGKVIKTAFPETAWRGVSGPIRAVLYFAANPETDERVRLRKHEPPLGFRGIGGCARSESNLGANNPGVKSRV